jgi:hypothetical protein
MRIRIVRDSDGQLVCAVPLDRVNANEGLVEPELGDGHQAEDVEVSASELVDVERLLQR